MKCFNFENNGKYQRVVLIPFGRKLSDLILAAVIAFIAIVELM